MTKRYYAVNPDGEPFSFFDAQIGKTITNDKVVELLNIAYQDERFIVPDVYRFSHSKVQLCGEVLTNAQIVSLLNRADREHEQNLKLIKENKKLEKDYKEAHTLLNIASELIFDMGDDKIQEEWVRNF